ncbi:MAG: oligosaccharide flippase family protein, partial [Actinomycetota bacterium]|nr:oligosaccharide flippase family protein [Actinomycetota bacterium]
RKVLTEDDRSTAFWMAIAAGVIFMILGFVLSAPIAALYGQPKTQPLFAALCVSFLISAPVRRSFASPKSITTAR